MLYAKVNRSKAERVRSLLARGGHLQKGSVLHSDSYVLFPVHISAAKINKGIEARGGTLVRNRGAAGPSPAHGQETRRTLTKRQRELLAGGYDLLGSIAIIELPDGLRAEERDRAEALLDSNSSIRTVLAKAGPVSGKYRTRKLRYIAGERNYKAVYKENGCAFTFDVRKVFFSSRLSYERSRIASLVSGREKAIVMFAGVGPYAIEMAKRDPECEVVAIEMNREAYLSMVDNAKANRTPNVVPVLGDVKRRAKDYRGFADRVVMPLPMSSLEYLGDAVGMARRRATIHLYAIGNAGSAVNEAVQKIKAHAKRHKYSVKVLGSRRVRNYSPRRVEVVVDFEVRKRG